MAGQLLHSEKGYMGQLSGRETVMSSTLHASAVGMALAASVRTIMQPVVEEHPCGGIRTCLLLGID